MAEKTIKFKSINRRINNNCELYTEAKLYEGTTPLSGNSDTSQRDVEIIVNIKEKTITEVETFEKEALLSAAKIFLNNVSHEYEIPSSTEITGKVDPDKSDIIGEK